MAVKIFAPAKINLSLHISAPIPMGERFAGYHNLDSLVAFAVDIGDELLFEQANEYSLNITGAFADELRIGDNNIITKALKLINNVVGTDLKPTISLVKNLPIASGIGGGSTNAAAAIIGIDRLFNLNLSEAQKYDIALKLGADVPVCLAQKPIIMQGIGDKFADALKFPDLPIILANPLIGCSTPLIYKEFDKIGDFKPIKGNYYDCDSLDLFIENLKQNRNDLENANFNNFPSVKELYDALTTLSDVQMVRMSGSGGSVFAVFKDIENAVIANQELIRIYKDRPLWSVTGKLAGNHG